MKAVIFDFDGTLTDTLPVAVRMVNRFAKKLGLKKVTAEQLRAIPLRDALREAGISLMKLPGFVRLWRREFAKELPHVKLVRGWKSVLGELKRRGYVLGILTSNAEENVRMFLEDKRVRVFDFVCSERSVFAKHVRLRRALREHGLKPDDVVYVGDETRDISAAKRVGAKAIAVSWGYDTEELLETAKPNDIIGKPAELLRLV